jgi:hypothetical protein
LLLSMPRARVPSFVIGIVIRKSGRSPGKSTSSAVVTRHISTLHSCSVVMVIVCGVVWALFFTSIKVVLVVE